MSLVRVSLALMVGAVVSMPQTADAGSWWEYIDKLSGPGPFLGLLRVSVPVTPSFPSDGTNPRVSAANSLSGLDGRLFYGVVEFGQWNAAASAKFPKEINLASYFLLAYFPLEPHTHFTVGAEAGVGFGFYHFTGPGVTRKSKEGKIPSDPHSGSLWTPAFPVRLKVTPGEWLRGTKTFGRPTARKILNVLHYEFGVNLLIRSFDNRDFFSDAPFRTHERHQWTHGAIVDLTPLLFKHP